MQGGRTEVEIQHGGQRRGIPPRPAAERRAFPAVHQQGGHVLRIGIGGDVAKLPGLFQADGNQVGDFSKAALDLALEHLAHARQFLPKSAQQATHVSPSFLVLPGHFKEPTRSHPRGGQI